MNKLDSFINATKLYSFHTTYGFVGGWTLDNIAVEFLPKEITEIDEEKKIIVTDKIYKIEMAEGFDYLWSELVSEFWSNLKNIDRINDPAPKGTGF